MQLKQLRLPERVLWPFALFILLLPFAKLAELACLIALLLLWPYRAQLRWHAASMSLAAITAAAFISAVDAAAPAEVLKSAANLLRFSGLVLIAALLTQAQHRFLLRLIAIVLLIWLLDASVQALSGYSIGGRLTADRLSGVFGADNLKLGPVLGALSPLLLFAPWPALPSGRSLSLLRAGVWLLLASVLLLAGSRASWVCFALASALAVMCYWRPAFRKNPSRAISMLLLSGMAIAIFAIGLYHADARVQARVDRTLSALQPGGIDTALAGRLPIWQTALDMSAAHPINGVGIREFRSAYPDFAQVDDPWVHQSADGQVLGAFHPHQIVLEILSETGAIGLLAWLLALALAIKAWREADAQQRALAWPYAAALIVMCFPINTHLAFYSSFWSSVFWWLAALYFAATRSRPSAN
jgi:O-antigen ligase